LLNDDAVIDVTSFIQKLKIEAKEQKKALEHDKIKSLQE